MTIRNAQPTEPSTTRKILCDCHTHTLFSRHAYSTIEENVRQAAERGLELLGSADHYSDMLFPTPDLRNFQYLYGVGSWPDTWHGVRLLHACEADIVDLKGRLFGWDLPFAREMTGTPFIDSVHTGALAGESGLVTLKDLVFSKCDYVIASIHNHDWADTAPTSVTTEMYIHALEDPKVLILGHPGRAGVPFEIDAVLECAKDLGKLIEINEHSLDGGIAFDSWTICRKIAQRCAEMGVGVCVNSDAHIAPAIGLYGNVCKMLDEIDFPQELVMNRDAATFLAARDTALG